LIDVVLGLGRVLDGLAQPPDALVLGRLGVVDGKEPQAIVLHARLGQTAAGQGLAQPLGDDLVVLALGYFVLVRADNACREMVVIQCLRQVRHDDWSVTESLGASSCMSKQRT
jgi:hypothetical protein